MLAGVTTLAPCVLGVNVFPIKPYDPVAVLEAMRDYGLYPGVFRNPNPARTQEIGWVAWIVGAPSESDRIHIQSTEQGVGPFPYFPSAVRWLHEQAAAVDAEFAERFPLPADLTNEQLDAVAEHLRATGQAKG